MKRQYVDHHICEECHGAHPEAFYFKTDWACPNRRYKVNRYSGTTGPCKKLIGRNIRGMISKDVCLSCSYCQYPDNSNDSWECDVNWPRVRTIVPWTKLPKECPKKMEHCVAITEEPDEP